MRTLNLGILAHVDAGKTTLTERLLYAAGVIDELGSVDDGNTRTDTLALERARGITIEAAVVSFVIHDVMVNLIDTPGHPDFIAEVERVLSVLDGAVLVISAMEGVQAQTRALMRTLQRLRIPSLLFVNKIDRSGAQYDGVLQAIAAKLTPAIVTMGSTRGSGTRGAEFIPHESGDQGFAMRLAEQLSLHDDVLLNACLADDASVSYQRLRACLATQTRQAHVHPVFFGSAITGAGIDALMDGIAGLLPAQPVRPESPVSGIVFKIERGPAGEKVAYLRMFSGTVRVRDRLTFGQGREGKVTSLAVFGAGGLEQRTAVCGGQIGKLCGLGDVRMGDVLGVSAAPTATALFAPPTLEAVVVPRRRADKGALHVALTRFAEQDPLINLRQGAEPGELRVSLYGAVQKEVIEATLANEFGIDVAFRDTTTICIERPIGVGEAVEGLQSEAHAFSATIGLRIEPAPIGSGLAFRLDVDERRLPLYVYRSREKFIEAMSGYVRHTLAEGLFGWEVNDCTVTMNQCGYYVGDGPGKPSGSTPRTTAAHFRKLTPMVLMSALDRAGTAVCEPIMHVSVEIPRELYRGMVAAIGRLGGVAEKTSMHPDGSLIETSLPVARAQDLARQLRGLTGGEGIIDTRFDGYRPVRGIAPVRRRTMINPLVRKDYLLHVTRGGQGAT